MNGVEILNITEHAIMEPAWSWQMCIGLFIGIFGISLLIGVINGLCEDDIWIGMIAGAAIGLVFALILSPILTAAFSKKEVGKEYHYKVTIDNSVSMNDFLDKYEILDQEGKIYTVKERE